MHVMVFGGAGYIGSHVVRRLWNEGMRVTVYDNLSTGHAASLDSMDVRLIKADVLDEGALASAFERDSVER